MIPLPETNGEISLHAVSRSQTCSKRRQKDISDIGNRYVVVGLLRLSERGYKKTP